MVPEHAAAYADALQVQGHHQVVKRAPHHPAEIVHQCHSLHLARARSAQHASGIGVTERRKTPRQGVAGDQRFEVADVAAAAQRVIVVADKHVARMASVAAFSVQ